MDEPLIGKGIKGIRSVQKSKVESETDANDAAYNKLFNVLLSNKSKIKGRGKNNEIITFELTNKYEYYSYLLKNTKKLQYMNMVILAEVLKFLDKYGGLGSKDQDKQIAPYINILVGKDMNNTKDSLIKIEINKNETSDTKQDSYDIIRNRTIITFIRYIIFIAELEKDTQKLGNLAVGGQSNNEEELDMIQPEIDDL